jgi:hypothetical protein
VSLPKGASLSARCLRVAVVFVVVFVLALVQCAPSEVGRVSRIVSCFWRSWGIDLDLKSRVE